MEPREICPAKGLGWDRNPLVKDTENEIGFGELGRRQSFYAVGPIYHIAYGIYCGIGFASGFLRVGTLTQFNNCGTTGKPTDEEFEAVKAFIDDRIDNYEIE